MIYYSPCIVRSERYPMSASVMRIAVTGLGRAQRSLYLLLDLCYWNFSCQDFHITVHVGFSVPGCPLSQLGVWGWRAPWIMHNVHEGRHNQIQGGHSSHQHPHRSGLAFTWALCMNRYPAETKQNGTDVTFVTSMPSQL